MPGLSRTGTTRITDDLKNGSSQKITKETKGRRIEEKPLMQVLDRDLKTLPFLYHFRIFTGQTGAACPYHQASLATLMQPFQEAFVLLSQGSSFLATPG
jgi:hypothetical protein